MSWLQNISQRQLQTIKTLEGTTKTERSTTVETQKPEQRTVEANPNIQVSNLDQLLDTLKEAPEEK